MYCQPDNDTLLLRLKLERRKPTFYTVYRVVNTITLGRTITSSINKQSYYR